MLLNLLIVLVIVLVLGILLSSGGTKKTKKAEVQGFPQKQEQIECKEPSLIKEKLTEGDKQAQLKVLGAQAFERGQEIKFQSMHILDFGNSLTALSKDITSIEQLSEEQKLLLRATVNDLIKGFNKDDILCFKSG